MLGHIRQLIQRERNGHVTKVPTFSRKELREACDWSLTQVRVHLERLVELEYLAVRHGRLGNPFAYEVLFDLDAPEAIAHVGLIDVARLRRDYDGRVAGFDPANADHRPRKRRRQMRGLQLPRRP